MNQNPLIQGLRNHFAGAEWPVINDLQALHNGWQMKLFISANIRWLEGHFPEQPLVAGVVQTHWAGCFAQALFPLGDALVRVDNLKFQQVMLPEQTIELLLEQQAGDNQQAIKFCYRQGDIIFSEGKLVFQLGAAQ